MATTLIDTRKSIMEQIHASWNQFRTLDYAYELLGFQYPETCKRFLEPMAKDFKKNDAPWSIKQSVLEGTLFTLISLFAYTSLLI